MPIRPSRTSAASPGPSRFPRRLPQGFRVLGTNGDYFTHLKYGQQQALELREGRAFDTPFEAVLGAQVAESSVITWGSPSSSPTAPATPRSASTTTCRSRWWDPGTDRYPHRSHHPRAAGRHRGDPPGLGHRPSQQERDRRAGAGAGSHPKTITAFMVGLSNRILAFQLQRSVNTYWGEPLMAILPGPPAGAVEPDERGGDGAVGDRRLRGGGGPHRHADHPAGRPQRTAPGLAILRSLGAGPAHLFLLLALEAMALTTAGIALGVAVLYLGQGLATPGCSATMACN